MAAEMPCLLYTLVTASVTPSMYGITTDVLWFTDLILEVHAAFRRAYTSHMRV